MQILKERPTGTDKSYYSWCPQCKGFVIALGKHCINNDKHLIEFLSPQEREEIVESVGIAHTRPKWGNASEGTKIKPKKIITNIRKSENISTGKANGRKIKAYREKNKVTIRELSELIGVRFNSLYLWESLGTNPNRHTSKNRAKRASTKIYNKLLEIINEQELSQDPFHDWKKEWTK